MFHFTTLMILQHPISIIYIVVKALHTTIEELFIFDDD